jgi:hypothetical protein
MLPLAHVTHRVPGRTRIKIPAKRGDSAYFRRLAEHLDRLPGLKGFTANPRTASVLMYHGIELTSIASRAAEEGLFRVEDPPSRNVPIARQVTDGLKGIDEGFAFVSSGLFDLKSVVLVALVGMGIYQIRKGDLLAPAASLLWYALNTAGYPPIAKP